MDPGHEDHHVPKSFTSRKQLNEFLTMIIFTCSCQHAAVNFSQMDVYAFPPNAPAIMRKPPPTKKGVVTMMDLMDCLATKHQSSVTIATVYDLTRIFADEVRSKQLRNQPKSRLSQISSLLFPGSSLALRTRLQYLSSSVALRFPY